MTASESPRSAAPPRDTAGAYGFHRRELIAIVVLSAVVIAVSVVQLWRQKQTTDGRQWTVHDVYVDTLLLSRDDAGTVEQTSPDRTRRAPELTTIDINTADERELQRVPGIGPALAQRIIVSRTVDGPFESIADLQRVHGIGTKTAARVAPWIRFSSTPRITMDTAEVRP
ncbi:MAG: hypothetical protein Kow0074_08490 [Candidatus Zixiibacteriota bacterium]